jgi:hypothetical protein
MRYQRGVEKLRLLAEGCESVKGWPPEEPFLLEAYVFGDMLRGADPLECVEVVLVLNLPPEDAPWESHPQGTMWLADRLRLDKGGFCYWWRSHLDPVCNHRIRDPVRFWSNEGPDEDVLQALAECRFDDLPRLMPSPAVGRERVAAELEAALGHLRAVHASYWDRDWRSEHRGLGRYPEHHLWEAVQGYLDVHDAAASLARNAGRP